MERYFGEHTPKLGFGLMRLPKRADGTIDMEQTKQMVNAFMEAGMTYFDTAYVYDNGASELAARAALVDRYPRSVYAGDQTECLDGQTGCAERPTAVLRSLERTHAGYIDYYLLHAIKEENRALYDDLRIWEFMKELKAQGLIRHWGFSFHGSPRLLDELLTQHPDVEFVQLQLNYADWEHPGIASRENYEVARKHGKSIVVMEPVKGGVLADPPKPVQEILSGGSGCFFRLWAFIMQPVWMASSPSFPVCPTVRRWQIICPLCVRLFQ
ncbi:MAG: aldo/keto reductase [Merdibacter sp.]